MPLFPRLAPVLVHGPFGVVVDETLLLLLLLQPLDELINIGLLGLGDRSDCIRLGAGRLLTADAFGTHAHPSMTPVLYLSTLALSCTLARLHTVCTLHNGVATQRKAGQQFDGSALDSMDVEAAREAGSSNVRMPGGGHCQKGLPLAEQAGKHRRGLLLQGRLVRE